MTVDPANTLEELKTYVKDDKATFGVTDNLMTIRRKRKQLEDGEVI